MKGPKGEEAWKEHQHPAEKQEEFSEERKRKRKEAGSDNALETVQAEVGDAACNPTDRMIVEDVFEEPRGVFFLELFWDGGNFIFFGIPNFLFRVTN